MQGEVEVRQRFLQLEHTEELLVLQGLSDLRLDDIGLLVDLLQEIQEGRGGLRKDLEKEARLLVRLERSERVIQEFLNDCIRLQTDRDEVLARDEDAKRQCIIRIRLKDDRGIHDDEDIVVFKLDMRTFFSIEGGLEGINGNARQLIDPDQLLQCRCRGIDPGPFFQLFQRNGGQNMIFIVFVCLYHGDPPLSGSIR